MPYLSTDDMSNKFQKGFQTTNNIVEDPTFMGFKILFDFSANSPLFYDGNDQPSAYQYLKSIGMQTRAEMLKKHKELLENLSKNADYYFQSISGLKEMWKLDLDDDSKWRTGEKLITIGMLEGLDMRVSGIIDLFRKAAYDATYMRELLPENLRKFKCYILVSEFRQFHTLKNLVETNSTDSTVTSGGNSTSKELQALNDLITTLTFELDDCQWDVRESYGFLDELNNKGDSDAVSQQLQFSADVIRERHEFQLLDFISDEKFNGDKSLGFSAKAFGRPDVTNYPASEITNSDKLRDKIQQRLKNEVISIKDEATSALTSRMARLESNLKNTLRNIYEKPLSEFKSGINSALLGNVYGFSENPLEAILKSFVGNKPSNINLTNVYDSVNPNAPQKTPDSFDDFKINPYLPNGPVDDFEYDKTPVNEIQTSPDPFTDLNPNVTSYPNGSANSYDYDSTSVNVNQQAPNGYDDFKIGTNTDQKTPNSFSDFKIPTNVFENGPSGFSDYKIPTNEDQKTPSSFNEYKIKSELPSANNLENFDDFKNAPEIGSIIPSSIYQRPDVNKELENKPKGFDFDDILVNQREKSINKLEGYSIDVNKKSDPITSFEFDKTEVNEEPNKIKKIDFQEPKLNNKLNPSSFEFDETPVNGKSSEIPGFNDYKEKPNDENQKKIDNINPNPNQ